MSTDKAEGRVVIRAGERTDCKELLRMVKDFGSYLNLGREIKITEQVLENDGFGERPFFECLVAEKPEYPNAQKDCPRLIGYALYSFTYSTFVGRCVFLQDLYVESYYRNHGLGTRLLKSLTKVCLDNECTRLWWNGLPGHGAAVDFYKRLGAEDLTDKEGWHRFHLERPEMEKFIKQ